MEISGKTAALWITLSLNHTCDLVLSDKRRVNLLTLPKLKLQKKGFRFGKLVIR